MKTVNEFMKEYGNYNIKNEKAILKLLERPRPKTVWDLKMGNRYWCMITSGPIVNDVWDDVEIDHQRRATGNCYLTREEAEFALEKKKIIAEMKRLGGTENMMSLGDKYSSKYSIDYSYEMNKICIDANVVWAKSNSIYFATEKQAQKAIDKIGEDRIKKYIFYVNE